MVDAWEESVRHFNNTRKAPNEYERIKQDIEAKGIHCKLRWYADTEWSGRDDPFYVIRVSFQPNFEHLIQSHAVQVKESSSTGFHISLGKRSAFHDNRGILRELSGIYNKYKEGREVFIKHVMIAPSSVINIEPNDALYKELIDVVWHGTWKRDVHISMD